MSVGAAELNASPPGRKQRMSALRGLQVALGGVEVAQHRCTDPWSSAIVCGWFVVTKRAIHGVAACRKNCRESPTAAIVSVVTPPHAVSS